MAERLLGPRLDNMRRGIAQKHGVVMSEGQFAVSPYNNLTLCVGASPDEVARDTRLIEKMYKAANFPGLNLKDRTK